MNLFEFLLVTLSNIISLNVRDGKIKLCFTDLGAEDLSLEPLLDHVDEALGGSKATRTEPIGDRSCDSRGDLKSELRWVVDAVAVYHQKTG